MRESRKKHIGGHDYEVLQLPPTKAQRLFVRIAKVVGPALAQLAAKGGTALADAAGELFTRLSEDDVDLITQQMSEQSFVDGKPMKSCFEVHFHGKQKDLWEWLLFSLEVQFGDFFGDMLSMLQTAAPLAATKSAASSVFPITSGGQPGASSSTELPR